MLIVATGLTQQPNDKQQVEPILEALAALPESLGKVDRYTATIDNGYFSAANVKACVERGIEPLIASGREAYHLPVDERFGPDALEPDTDDPVVQVAWWLKTKDGRACYTQRKSSF